MKKLIQYFSDSKLGQWHRRTSKWNWLKHIIAFLILFLGIYYTAQWVGSKYPNKGITAEVSVLFALFPVIFTALGLEEFQKRTKTGDFSWRDFIYGVAIPLLLTILTYTKTIQL